MMPVRQGEIAQSKVFPAQLLQQFIPCYELRACRLQQFTEKRLPLEPLAQIQSPLQGCGWIGIRRHGWSAPDCSLPDSVIIGCLTIERHTLRHSRQRRVLRDFV